MGGIREKLLAADWTGIRQEINDRGFAVIDKERHTLGIIFHDAGN